MKNNKQSNLKKIARLFILVFFSSILLNSCKKEEDNKKSKITNQKEGNAEGNISFNLNGKDYNFNIYKIDITEESPSVLYRFLVTGETENQRMELYIYPNKVGEYTCGTPSANEGTFNIMIVEKNDNALSIFYNSTNQCKLSINKLENYKFMERDINDSWNIISPGSLDLIEVTFTGSGNGHNFTEGSIIGKIKYVK